MLILDVVSLCCFMLGGFLLITGGVGVLRLPEFFSRIHAAGVTETMATPLILIGLILQVGLSLEAAKLALILIFVLATSPGSTHAMASAALHGGYDPEVGLEVQGDQEDASSKT